MPIFASLRTACRIGNKWAQFISSRFVSPTLYLSTYALNGSLNVKHNCVFIHNLGAPTSNANIMNDFQERSNAGWMLAMVLAFCADVSAVRS